MDCSASKTGIVYRGWEAVSLRASDSRRKAGGPLLGQRPKPSATAGQELHADEEAALPARDDLNEQRETLLSELRIGVAQDVIIHGSLSRSKRRNGRLVVIGQADQRCP